MADSGPVVALIPAYNERATIVDLVTRVISHVDQVIVIDDASSDGTADLLVGLPVEVIRNAENLGKSASLRRGFRHARALGAPIVVTLDADGQHLPEDIPRLLSAAVRNPGTIIIGARLRHRECMPRLRRFGNAMADFWISWAAGYPIRDTQSGMRAYPAEALACIDTSPMDGSRFVLESQILIDSARAGWYARWIDIETIYGVASRSSYYRAVADTVSIIFMVARKLLQRGLNPAGLLRSLGMLPLHRPAPTDSGFDPRPDLKR